MRISETKVPAIARQKTKKYVERNLTGFGAGERDDPPDGFAERGAFEGHGRKAEVAQKDAGDGEREGEEEHDREEAETGEDEADDL